MNIVVLAGGISNEREVSICSGIEIWKAVNDLGHNAILINVSSDINSNIDFTKKGNFIKNSISKDVFLGKGVLDICAKSDMVFLALHGGDGENGKIQATFDLLGIRYTGCGYLTNAITMNKFFAKLLLNQNNILVPKGIRVSKFDEINLKEISKQIGFPCILKPLEGGSSIDVFFIKNQKDLDDILKKLLTKYDDILIEQYIYGREISVGIIDEKVLPIIEIINNDNVFDYKSKYISSNTKEICPAKLTKELEKKIIKTSVKIKKCLNLNVYSRIDYIFDTDNNLYCLEVNSLPGMTKSSLLPKMAKTDNIGYKDLCNFILDKSLDKYI